MIDPDNIMKVENNRNTVISINEVPEMDYLIWDLEDSKEYKKYLSTIEKEVRGSFEYRQYVSYLKNFCGMNECAFLQVSGYDNRNIKIEIHHYPYTLYDLVEIVYRKRVYYQESLSVYMVAKEVCMLHYQSLVGLISLSTTVHQLYHDGKLFIPVDHVYGNYPLFTDIYKPFLTTEQLDALERIEQYTKNKSDINDTTVLDTNMITYDTRNQNYQLPSIETIEDKINQRIELIKKNNYRLPTIEDMKEINRVDQIEDRKIYRSPIVFFDKK